MFNILCISIVIIVHLFLKKGKYQQFIYFLPLLPVCILQKIGSKWWLLLEDENRR